MNAQLEGGGREEREGWQRIRGLCVIWEQCLSGYTSWCQVEAPCLCVRPPGQDRCIQGTGDAEVRKNPTPGHSNFDAGHSNSDTG